MADVWPHPTMPTAMVVANEILAIVARAPLPVQVDCLPGPHDGLFPFDVQ
jgi:hypothetical protein